MLESLIQIARKAGEAILEVYHQPSQNWEVQAKSDDSPLTAADEAAHQVIVAGLSAHFPDIPVLSEEGKRLPYADRKHWTSFFLVDPLDGTKEFIKRNGEFTVNIAYVQEGKAVMGVVYAPVLDRMFAGEVGVGAWEYDPQGVKTALQTSGKSMDAKGLRVVASRSHPSPELAAYMDALDQPEIVHMGSSLKIVLIATGEADLYPRLGPTMEWDTGAAHAVLAAAGGKLLRHDSEVALLYNKENLLNPWFIAQAQ